MGFKIRFAILCLLAGLGPACADEAVPSVIAKEKQTVEAYAAANKSCHEWTDGCLVCLRHEDGTFVCSLPGIACLPTGLTCRAVAQEASPQGPATKPTPAQEPPAK